MTMRSAARLILGNLLVLIGLLLALLFVLSAFGDAFNLAKSFFPKRDSRADLPAYEDHDRAQLVFDDQKGSVKNYAPFVEWRQAAKSSAMLNIDAEGRRLHKIGADNNKPDAVTLGVFGGSTVWGTGVDDDGTLPAQLDAVTDQYIVRNYGERGYTSFQNLIDLMQELNQNRAPRVVVFFEGFNDIWAHCNAAVTQSLNSHIEERRIQSALDRTAKENYLYNNIIVPIMVLWSEAIGGAEETVTPSCSGDPKRADAVAEMTVRNLEMAATLTQANGGRFHAFLQPNAYVGQPRTDYLQLTKPQNLLMRAEFAAVYPLIRAKMAERSHKWFFDISNVLDNDRYLLIDHAHVTDAGNRLLAEAIKARMSAN